MENIIGLSAFVLIAVLIIEFLFGRARRNKGIKKFIWFILALGFGIYVVGIFFNKTNKPIPKMQETQKNIDIPNPVQQETTKKAPVTIIEEPIKTETKTLQKEDVKTPTKNPNIKIEMH